MNLREAYSDEEIVALRAATASELIDWVSRERNSGLILDLDDPCSLVVSRWLLAVILPGEAPTVATSVAATTLFQREIRSRPAR